MPLSDVESLSDGGGDTQPGTRYFDCFISVEVMIRSKLARHPHPVLPSLSLSLPGPRPADLPKEACNQALIQCCAGWVELVR